MEQKNLSKSFVSKNWSHSCICKIWDETGSLLPPALCEVHAVVFSFVRGRFLGVFLPRRSDTLHWCGWYLVRRSRVDQRCRGGSVGPKNGKCQQVFTKFRNIKSHCRILCTIFMKLSRIVVRFVLYYIKISGDSVKAFQSCRGLNLRVS